MYTRINGCTQIRDEAALLKLFDRSNIEVVSTDNGDKDLEYHMLGSVKSVDWNDEATEEQGGAESPSVLVDGPASQNLEKNRSTELEDLCSRFPAPITIDPVSS
ncbi:protein CHROMATIN REMODELING 4-like [Helianthus annuus]|uniref:protein CHROMATIN REMODELING 4-like n=1 Tax=Helianthus annuus TaxID=4232 RepID=UPI000B8FAB1C|nr:protein CHROMATIN REMODELING 4-like [Helianthus annuus]